MVTLIGEGESYEKDGGESVGNSVNKMGPRQCLKEGGVELHLYPGRELVYRGGRPGKKVSGPGRVHRFYSGSGPGPGPGQGPSFFQ